MESREIILIFGKTGSGKSTKSKEYINNYERVFIVDPMGEYEGTVFTSFDELSEYYIKYEPDNFNFVCRFESDLDVEYLFKLVFEVGDCLLVVEEAEIYISPHVKQSSFLKLVRYGRHRNVSILGIARRATELSNDLKANVTKIFSFKQTNPIDLDNMKKLGFEGLENLENHTYIEMDF